MIYVPEPFMDLTKTRLFHLRPQSGWHFSTLPLLSSLPHSEHTHNKWHISSGLSQTLLLRNLISDRVPITNTIIKFCGSPRGSPRADVLGGCLGIYQNCCLVG